jgi:putative cell wall-binding protein
MLGGSAANAATTTVAVPSAAYGQYFGGDWNGTDPAVAAGATSLQFTLPSAVQGWGVTSVQYTLTVHAGQSLTGTVPVASDGTVTVPVAAGALVANDQDSFEISGSVDGGSSSAPAPDGVDASKSFDFSGGLAPDSTTTTNVIDLGSAAAGGGYAGQDSYWAAPSSALTLRPGDSVVLQAPNATIFSGQVTASLDETSGGDDVPTETSLSADGTTLTVTVPSSADVSSIAGDPVELDVSMDTPSTVSGGNDSSEDVEVPVDVAGATAGPLVSRVSGADRYSTSVELAKKGYPYGAGTVYVATGTNFPDALGAASAAAYEGGPLLLTDPSSLPAVVSDEITSLNPSEIKVVGGTSAVSDFVVDQLKKIAPTQRISGASRYDTDQSVILDSFGSSASEVYIATGTNFPDALSASAAAGAAGDPVVLVNGSAPSLDPETLSFLQHLGATSFRVAGGTSAVSPGIASALAGLGTVDRYAGASRYETSQLISEAEFPGAKHVYAATGTGFADALSGAALAAAKHAPLYVVQPTCVPAADLSTFTSASAVTLIGGTSALSANVAALGRCS